MYASWTGAEWNIQSVGPNSKAFVDGPLVDSNGSPHLLFTGDSKFYGYVAPSIMQQQWKLRRLQTPSISEGSPSQILTLVDNYNSDCTAAIALAFVWKACRT
jgi:hypothetical protein